jgi:hypothetical protein
VATTVQRLNVGEGDRWRRIRLRALQEAPHAFGITFAEASAWPSSRWEQQVAATALVLDVVEDNYPAIALYASRGFELFTGDSLGERAAGEIRMVKLIASIRDAD